VRFVVVIMLKHLYLAPAIVKGLRALRVHGKVQFLTANCGGQPGFVSIVAHEHSRPGNRVRFRLSKLLLKLTFIVVCLSLARSSRVHNWIDRVPHDMQVHSGEFKNLTVAIPESFLKTRTIDLPRGTVT